MSSGPGQLRTVLIVLGSNWFSLLLNILRVLVLPSKLGDTGLGMVTLAISFTTFFGIFTSLGVSTYLVRAVARDRNLAGSYIANALILRVGMGAGILGVALGIAGFLYTPQTVQVIGIVGISMLIFTISNVFEAGLQALEQQSWRAIAVAIGQVVATCVGVTMLLMGADAVTYALSIPLGMSIQFAIVLSYYFLKHPIKFSLDTGIMRALLFGGMPLFMWGFLQTAYAQIDATILSLFAGEHVVGWFGAAAQITNVLVLIPTAVSAVALPLLCRLYVEPGERFRTASSRALVTTLLVTVPVGVGLSASAGDVMAILPYPDVFMNSVPVLRLMALAVPVTGFLMVLSTLAVAIGQEKEWVKISAFAVCIFPPLYVSLIWWFQTNAANGAIGAASANLIGEAALVVCAWVVLPRQIRHADVVHRGLQIGAVTVVMLAAVVFMQSMGVPLLVYVPVAGAVYLTGAWLLRLITPGDLAVVRNALLRRRRRAEAVS